MIKLGKFACMFKWNSEKGQRELNWIEPITKISHTTKGMTIYAKNCRPIKDWEFDIIEVSISLKYVIELDVVYIVDSREQALEVLNNENSSK